MTKGVALAYAGRRREAIILMTGVLDLTEELALEAEGLRARLNISQFQMASDPRQAFAIAGAGLERALKFGFRDWADLLFGNAAVAATATGDWDWILATGAKVLGEGQGGVNAAEGLAQMELVAAYRGEPIRRFDPEELARQFEGSADVQVGAQLQTWRAAEALARGDLVAADGGADVPESEPYYATAGLASAGHAAIWRGDVDRLRAVVDRFAQIGLRGRSIDAELETFRAAVSALEAAPNAGDQFAAAAEEWRELDLPLGRGLCLMAFGGLLGATDERARRAQEDARAIFTGLGAAALLERLDEVISQGPMAGGRAAEAAATRARSAEGTIPG